MSDRSETKPPADEGRLDRRVGRLEPERAAYDAWYAAATFETMGHEWTWAGWQAGAAWQRADMQVLACQVDSLRAALLKVLDTREQEAKAWFAYETAHDNFTGGAALESRRHLAMMQAASSAEKEARLLLATLKTPNAELSGPQRPARKDEDGTT